MRLILTIEAQNCTENGLAEILKEVNDKLWFVTNGNTDLENQNNYGLEFKSIAIIPSCMDDGFWSANGWKERKLIWRKKAEADIRLRMDYERFVSETNENKFLLFVDTILKSIQIVQEKSKGDFKGDSLIKDILSTLEVTPDDLLQLYND